MISSLSLYKSMMYAVIVLSDSFRGLCVISDILYIELRFCMHLKS